MIIGENLCISPAQNIASKKKQQTSSFTSYPVMALQDVTQSSENQQNRNKSGQFTRSQTVTMRPCRGLKSSFETVIILRMKKFSCFIRIDDQSNSTDALVHQLTKVSSFWTVCNGKKTQNGRKCDECSSFEENKSFLLMYTLYKSTQFLEICNFIKLYRNNYQLLDIRYNGMDACFYFSNIAQICSNIKKPLFVCRWDGNNLTLTRYSSPDVLDKKDVTTAQKLHRQIKDVLGDHVVLCAGFKPHHLITANEHGSIFTAALFNTNGTVRHNSCTGIVNEGSKKDNICLQCYNVKTNMNKHVLRTNDQDENRQEISKFLNFSRLTLSQKQDVFQQNKMKLAELQAKVKKMEKKINVFNKFYVHDEDTNNAFLELHEWMLKNFDKLVEAMPEKQLTCDFIKDQFQASVNSAKVKNVPLQLRKFTLHAK